VDEIAHSPESPPAHEEPRRRHHVAPAEIAIDRIDADEAFQLRPVGELSPLATDLARLGQLFPVDLRLKPPDRFQVICGFRRIAALKFLQRDRVLARLHTDLSDDDALLIALAAAVHSEGISRDGLKVLEARLEEEGRLSPAARDMLSKAVGEEPLAPEHVEDTPAPVAEAPDAATAPTEAVASEEEEVDADELAQDIASRLGEVNQDLSLIADVFESLEPERKEELLKQLRYSAELVAFLEGR
jgi:ParB family chromosome partitioning protein